MWVSLHCSDFDGADADETAIRSLATQLWHDVDWNAYRKTPDAIYWLWSPTAGWNLSFPVSGWNECMIVYLLGVAGVEGISPGFVSPSPSR